MKSVADVMGPWVDPDSNSGLIERCKRNWNVPVTELSNEVLATFLRQNIASELIIPEAQRRLANNIDDDSELYEGELTDALSQVLGP